MNERVTIRFSKETFQNLKQEAAKRGLPLAEFIRRCLENFSIEDAKNFQPSPNLKKENTPPSDYPLLAETVLLLRELILQRDSQILRKVDSELDHLFGPERKKIYED